MKRTKTSEFDKEEQDKKDLECIREQNAAVEKKKAIDEKERIKKDKETLQYFDTKFTDEPLDNIYQLSVPRKPSLMDYRMSLFYNLYFRVIVDINHPVSLNVKGEYVRFTIDVRYVNEILDHHFNLYKGDKKDFLYELSQGIGDVMSQGLITGRKEFKDTTTGEAFDKWVDRKMAFLEMPEQPPFKQLPSEIEHNEPHLNKLISGLSFRGSFKDPLKYAEVIETLIKNSNIEKDANGDLIFIKGKRRNAKYEASSLYLILMEYGLITWKKAELTSNMQLEILKNTFVGFTCNIKTLFPQNTLGFDKSKNYWRAVLSTFKP